MNLRLPCVFRPTSNHGAPGSGAYCKTGEGSGGSPWPGPLTFSFCLVTRQRRELSLRFTLVLLLLRSPLLAPSSLLKDGRMNGGGGGGQHGQRAIFSLQVAPGPHLESVSSLQPLSPVSLLWSPNSLLLPLTYSLNKHLWIFAKFPELWGWVYRGDCDMVSSLGSLSGEAGNPGSVHFCLLPLIHS